MDRARRSNENNNTSSNSNNNGPGIPGRLYEIPQNHPAPPAHWHAHLLPGYARTGQVHYLNHDENVRNNNNNEQVPREQVPREQVPDVPMSSSNTFRPLPMRPIPSYTPRVAAAASALQPQQPVSALYMGRLPRPNAAVHYVGYNSTGLPRFATSSLNGSFGGGAHHHGCNNASSSSNASSGERISRPQSDNQRPHFHLSTSQSMLDRVWCPNNQPTRNLGLGHQPGNSGLGGSSILGNPTQSWNVCNSQRGGNISTFTLNQETNSSLPAFPIGYNPLSSAKKPNNSNAANLSVGNEGGVPTKKAKADLTKGEHSRRLRLGRLGRNDNSSDQSTDVVDDSTDEDDSEFGSACGVPGVTKNLKLKFSHSFNEGTDGKVTGQDITVTVSSSNSQSNECIVRDLARSIANQMLRSAANLPANPNTSGIGGDSSGERSGKKKKRVRGGGGAKSSQASTSNSRPNKTGAGTAGPTTDPPATNHSSVTSAPPQSAPSLPIDRVPVPTVLQRIPKSRHGSFGNGGYFLKRPRFENPCSRQNQGGGQVEEESVMDRLWKSTYFGSTPPPYPIPDFNSSFVPLTSQASQSRVNDVITIGDDGDASDSTLEDLEVELVMKERKDGDVNKKKKK